MLSSVPIGMKCQGSCEEILFCLKVQHYSMTRGLLVLSVCIVVTSFNLFVCFLLFGVFVDLKHGDKQTNKNLRCGNRKGLLGRNDQTHHNCKWCI